MPTGNLPENFRRNIRNAFPEGAAWLESLPALIADCERRWRVRVADTPFDLSYNFVAPAVTENGIDAVVKIGVPCAELRNEIAALGLYAGGAAVELLDADARRGMLLLERARPGSKLSEVDDDEQATVIAARTARELWRQLPPAHAFPGPADWALGLRRLRQRFDGGTGPFDPRLVGAAESLFGELLGSSQAPMLVHGDLHHFNILSSTRRQWLAIDPKGLAAEPAYEVGALLRNPGPGRYLDPAVQRGRVAVLADQLGFDPRRIAGWDAAQAVLSAWWTYEEWGNGWELIMVCAGILLEMHT